MKKIYLLVFLLNFSLFYSQDFSGTTGFITDDGQNNDYIVNVSGLSQTNLNATLGITKVCLNINHTYDSDLTVSLISPDGTSIILFSNVGGGGDNFFGTCLSQTAANSISSGNPPFSGSYKPQENFGDLNNGQNGNGSWILRIVDEYAVDSGVLNSWSITFDSGASTPFVLTSSNLPIVEINTNNIAIPDEEKINATMGIIDNGVGNINYITDVPNNYNGNIGIELRGHYSQTLPQKPYRIETRDAAFAELDASLLGMPSEHDWNLIANYNDKVFIRNSLAYKIFTDMGNYATRNKFCEVVLNGRYQGIYLLTETIKRDSNRVNIAKLEPNENSGLNVTGGYILKNDYYDNTDSFVSNFHPIDHPNLDVHIVYDYPKPDVITPEQKTYLQSFVNDFETSLYATNFTDPVNGYKKYIDVNSFIDYFIVNELARNNDGFKKSSYFNKTINTTSNLAKLKAGPVWDFDWAFKNIPGCVNFAATNGSGWAYLINDCGPDVNSTGWFVRLLQDQDFQNKLRCRWETLRTTILSNATITSYIDQQATYLNDAQARHFEKWQNLGFNTGTPEIENDPNTFSGEILKFKNWINSRLTWLDNNIPGTATNCSLAINDIQKSAIVISPNPANNTINITTEDSITALFIYDTTGKIILSKNNFEGKIIDVSALANGFYLFKINLNNETQIIKKVVIQH